MNEPIGNLRGGRHISTMVLLLVANACTQWHPLPGASLAETRIEQLGHARLVLRDGTELDVRNATLGRDSIVGFGGETRVRFAVARTEVNRVESRQPNGAATFLVGGITPVVALTLLFGALILRYGLPYT
jgi:hypothetical protein